jgi:hypothetical protein
MASYEHWLDVFQLAYRAPRRFWCGSCLEGMAPGPCEVPAACTPVRQEDAGVPNYRIVQPAGRNEHALPRLEPMTYFADLSDYSYSPSGEKILNVGWLGRGKAFETGTIGEGIWDELVRLASEPVNVMRGLHDCEFCETESPVRIPSDYSLKRFASLGTGEIRVRGDNGRSFAAPTLLLHYVQSHNYLPPEVFIHAVRALRERRRANTRVRWTVAKGGAGESGNGCHGQVAAE